MTNDIKQLLCNYWDLHGSFDGAEKTCLLEEIQRTKQPCEQMYVVGVRTFANRGGFQSRFKEQPELTETSLQSILLVAHYVVSSLNSVVELNGEKVRTSYLFRNLVKGHLKTYEVAKSAVEQVTIVSADEVAMSGNILYTPDDAKCIRRSATRLLQYLLTLQCRLGPNNPFMMAILKRKDYYFSVVALADAFHMTVNDICSIYDYSMPDFFAALEQFGTPLIVQDEDVILFKEDESIRMSRMEFMMMYNQSIGQSSDTLQQIGAFR